MDDSTLFDEVLQLSLHRHCGEATEEELARLECLLGSSRQAVVYYLQIVQDGLAIREFAEVRSNQPLDRALTTTSHADDNALQSASATRPTLRWWSQNGFFLVAATVALVVTGALLSSWNMSSNPAPGKVARIARIINFSGVQWSAEAKQYFPWSQIAPGDVLKFQRGIINLFIDNGVELLVEGPAEVRFQSLEQVVVVEGKLAARVGPDAIGFSIETPHANVIDRGTVFGVSVDNARRTDVVVYEGIVDLDVLGHGAQPRRRLATGEALRVSNQGSLSRIASVQGEGFLSPPQVRHDSTGRAPVIASVTDNIRLHDTAKFNRVIPAGFEEDCRAYVDREHEWNGVDASGLPSFLVGGDYVMTFNEDKTAVELALTVELARPANLYILIDNRVPPPEWLTRDFVDTNVDVGMDEVHSHINVETAVGAGISLDQFFSVWKRVVHEPTSVVLGPLGHEKYEVPARVVKRGMYGIVATPLESDAG
jgi:FecR protein